MLNDTQIDHYHEHGYVIPDFQMPGIRSKPRERTACSLGEASPRFSQLLPGSAGSR
jgi:hypothetical protein